MQSLDELRRMIRRVETRRPPRPAAPPAHEVLGGELVETGAGPLLVVRREYPLTHTHGREPLGPAFAAPLDLLSAAARAETPAGNSRGLLFLDTEATGLAGGTGTYTFLVGVGRLDGDRFIVEQYFMRDFDEEPALLAALVPLLEQAAGVVTFNGSAFDLPLIETRFVLARRRWPPRLPHLDLLRPARRVFAPRCADCRLTTLEREVLGLEREDDVPGALIPTLYFDFLRSRPAATSRAPPPTGCACAWRAGRSAPPGGIGRARSGRSPHVTARSIGSPGRSSRSFTSIAGGTSPQRARPSRKRSSSPTWRARRQE